VSDPQKPYFQFIEERKYLLGVTDHTLIWYENAFKHFEGCSTESQYKARIIELRQRGVTPISINSWLRVINAYLHWHSERNRKCSPACTHLKLSKLKEETKILKTFTPTDEQRLLSVKVKFHSLSRAQSLAGLLLDTGLRISEALQLRKDDVDLDNFLIRVRGKGRKERLVPFSSQGRKILYHLTRKGGYLFPTRGGHVGVRNAHRDLTRLYGRAGIRGVRCSPHTLRHTFATSYLKNGGNLEFLCRILGHSSILVTQRYL
jgi:integrase/recombinase XerD